MNTYECPKCGNDAVPVYIAGGNLVCICCSNCQHQTAWNEYLSDAEVEWGIKKGDN